MKIWTALFGVVCSILASSSSVRADSYEFAVAANTIDTVVSEVIIKKAYEMLGHQIEIIRLPPKRALEGANSGNYDGDVQRIHNVAKSFPNLIRLEPPINYANGTGFVLEGKKYDINSWQDLINYRVGIILGIKFAEINVPKESAVIFYDYHELSKALADKRIDVGIYPESNGIYQTLLSGDKDIIPFKEPLTKFELFHYIHKKNLHLVEDLQGIFRQFKEAGTLAKVRQQVLEISFKRAREGLKPCFDDYGCYQKVWDE